MVKPNTLKTGDKSVTSEQKSATTAHLIETAAHHAAHSQRHLLALRKSKGKAAALDQEHAETHMNGTIDHVQKLMAHVQSNYPAESKELGKLQDTVARSDIGAKVKSAHQEIKKKK